LSDLSPAKPDSFFQRVVELLKTPNPPKIELASVGPIGPEMRQAWKAEEPGRSQIAQKLQDAGFEEAGIQAIFSGVELVELNEAEERTAVFFLVQEALTGVDSESAFDLLNFWLYTVAEQRSSVTRADVVKKITDVGRFLSERHAHHAEWFTSIKPIIDQSVSDDRRAQLKDEFYAGVSTRYEHILADLDFRRYEKLDEVAEALESNRVVIIHAASGQGKTALAYRYLHDFYPEVWRFSIGLIENRQHALSIALALTGHAKAIQASMAVFVDVSSRDTDWPELVKHLAQFPYLQILVAIREEDFRRANISGAEFDYASVDLGFDETEARLRIPPLVSKLNLPEPTRTLELFEKEYLLRLSPDRPLVEGLHPIRSGILVDLLTDPGVVPWLAIASQALPMMVEEDLESFILYAFVNRPLERAPLLDAIRQLQPTTWAGLAGILRAFLWLGVCNYVEANLDVIDAAREEFGQGWLFVVDLDLANIVDKTLGNWWTQLGDIFSSERQAKLEQIRARQTPKEMVFELADSWLANLDKQPLPPSSPADWSGAAELCFWGGERGVAPSVEKWLSDENLVRAVEELPLATLADVSLGIYTCNQERHRAWIQTCLPKIQARLAHEYNIVHLEEQENILKLHFLPTSLGEEGGGERKKPGKRQPSTDPLHDEAIERIELARRLLPHYEAYGSQGHGYRFGSLQSPFDTSTTKEGIPISSLPPAWPVQINSITSALGDNRYRPATWAEYVERVLEMRHLIVTNFQELQKGLVKYLQRHEAVALLGKHIDVDIWLQCYAMVTRPPMLPTSAVDPWGFAQESSSDIFAHSFNRQLYLPAAIALREYAPYHKAERDYALSLSNFLQQAQHVMVTNFHMGKLPAYSPQRAKRAEILPQMGIKTDLAHLATYNLDAAQGALLEYQRQFRSLVGGKIQDTEKLDLLEDKERDLMFSVWQLWYFFAHDPGQTWASPLSQVPAKINLKRQQLERKIREAIAKVIAKGVNIDVLPVAKGWGNAPTLWLRLDLEDPTQLYAKVEELLVALQETIGQVDIRELDYYVIKQNWEYIAVVPIIRGRMLNRLAWRLYAFTILSKKDGIGSNIWLYVPQELSAENWGELGLKVWSLENVALANRLSEAVAALSFLAAQISDLRDIPDMTETGLKATQDYVEAKTKQLNSSLQATFDALSAMLDKFSELSVEEQQKRSDLKEAISGISELHLLVQPSEEFDGEQIFTIDEILGYAKRLERAPQLAEAIRLFWIKDALDHMAASDIDSGAMPSVL
jgi:hypothetical protein